MMNWTLRLLLALPLALALLFGAAAEARAQQQPWMNKSLSPGQRAQLLASAMSQDQQLSMVYGESGGYVGNVPSIDSLGIPALNLQDGPAGVADGVNDVTCFPAPITLAATWDTALAKSYGDAMGAEQAGKGTNVALAPMMNMLRVPEAGRNYEGLGEDPVLTSAMAAAIVQGIQGNGIIATAKHFIGNEQETNRGSSSSIIDDRTLHEIYLPPFAASVNAGVGAVMCSYNLVQGVWACENPTTLTTFLKGELQFKGFVMSDWGATHSTVPSATAGLDMEMPSGDNFGGPLESAVSSGAVTAARVTDMVTRILTAMFAAGLFDRAPRGSLDADVRSTAHTQLTRQIGAQGAVLLSNAMGVLPLGTTKIHSIAVVGSAADDDPVFQGGGSSQVNASPGSVVSPRQGITTRAGANINVGYADGNSAPYSDATSLARQSDVAIVVVGLSSSEGSDRSSLSLPDPGDALIAAVAQANPKTVVVVYAPGQILMPWASQVAAILYDFLPGQEEGDSLADVLFGDVNPSGKLPFTIANARSDYPVNTQAQWPGLNNAMASVYSEGFLTGYRGFDAEGIAPLFPFGHGLSYTTFKYANLAVSPGSVQADSATEAGGEGGVTSTKGTVNVSFDVTNTGSVSGAEVAQLYVGMPSETSEPPWQLEAFQKVTFAAGATQHFSFALAPAQISFWSDGRRVPTVYPGTYRVAVGSSSRDVRLQGSFNVWGGPLSGTIHQAETANACCGATMESGDAGATGSGYVAFGTMMGAKVTFDLNVPSSGSCAITARYSAAQSSTTPQPAHTLSLYANGTKVGQVTFPPLANLSTWDFETQTVNLDEGDDTVAYEEDQGDTGNVNIDAIVDCVPGPLSVAPPSDSGAEAGMNVGATDSGEGEDAAVGYAGEGSISKGVGSGCGCAAVGSSSAAGAWLFGLLLLRSAARRLISGRNRAQEGRPR